MISMINLIQQNITLSGCISLTTMLLGKFFTVLGAILGLSFGLIGAVVGLITIYSFLEKKGLLPKWAKIKDRTK